jgi:SH3 domain protein
MTTFLLQTSRLMTIDQESPMPRKTVFTSALRLRAFPIALRLLLAISVALTGTPLCAATWYVKPSAEVPVRSGQGSDFKILAVVPDGMTVELLEEVDVWARVRTPGGTEGWLLKRYLTSEPPPSVAVEKLQAENTRLTEINDEISRKHDELSAVHGQKEQELGICLAERNEISASYETLRRDTADVISIQNRLAETTQALEETKSQLIALEKKQDDQKRNDSLLWFLAGAGVMLSGWFLGAMTARSRKKKSSLLS